VQTAYRAETAGAPSPKLIDDDAARKVMAKREYIAELLSPHVVFAELAKKLAKLQRRAAERPRCAS
jgi:hypothetical protein